MILNVRQILYTGIICTKFEVGQLIRFWLIKFLLLIRHVTLWPWPLTLWTWMFVVYRMSRDQTLYQIWATSNNPRPTYCGLPSSWIRRYSRFRGLLGPIMRQHIKFQHNQSMLCRVINGFTTFPGPILRGLERRDAWAELYKFGVIVQSSAVPVCFRF